MKPKLVKNNYEEDARTERQVGTPLADDDEN